MCRSEDSGNPNSAAYGASAELQIHISYEISPHAQPNNVHYYLKFDRVAHRLEITMAPLVPVFSAESLPDHVNTVRRNFQEKRRKGQPIDLKECPLLEMTQFSCNPPQDGVPEPGVVVCKPVVRLFRR